MRYPGTRGTVEQFFTLWYSVPQHFAGFESPEDIITHLASLGFDMRLYRRRPSKKLALHEKHANGMQLSVHEGARLLGVFSNDVEYTRKFLTAMTDDMVLMEANANLRQLHHVRVEPGYAARLGSAGVAARTITAMWAEGVAEEYVLAIA
jgi:hypothetical protein